MEQEISKKTIQPVKNYLLLEVQVETETSSGILLAEPSNMLLPTVGTVLKAGEQAHYKTGDVVMFRKYSADEIKITTAEGEEQYWMLEDTEVIAVVVEKQEEREKYEQINLKKGIIRDEGKPNINK